MFGSANLYSGQLGDYRFEVRLTRDPVSYGLDPHSLYKGKGRVARLTLYRSLGPTGLNRKVAHFDGGWHFGRKSHLRVIARLVRLLEKNQKISSGQKENSRG